MSAALGVKAGRGAAAFGATLICGWNTGGPPGPPSRRGRGARGRRSRRRFADAGRDARDVRAERKVPRALRVAVRCHDDAGDCRQRRRAAAYAPQLLQVARAPSCDGCSSAVHSVRLVARLNTTRIGGATKCSSPKPSSRAGRQRSARTRVGLPVSRSCAARTPLAKPALCARRYERVGHLIVRGGSGSRDEQPRRRRLAFRDRAVSVENRPFRVNALVRTA